MKTFLKSAAAGVLILFSTAGTQAQGSDSTEIIRPVASAYTLRAGSTRINDTYLTPLDYKGWSTAFDYERYQATKFSPEKWIRTLGVTAGFGLSQNPARNATIYEVGLRADWAMMRRWKISPVPGLTLAAGGEIEADLGALYLSRNGNNPVAAKAALTAGVTGMAVYNFRIKSLPVTLRYRTSMPLLGTFFSQEYGELYYEIYLGDRSGLACFANPATYFRFCNYISADLRFGSTWLRIGYRNDLTSTRVHNLTTNISSHSFVIGISGEWISVNSRKGLSGDARVISALY